MMMVMMMVNGHDDGHHQQVIMGVRGGQIEEGEDEVMEEASQRRLPSARGNLSILMLDN